MKPERRSSPTIRPATPADVDAIVALQRMGLGEGTLARTAEVWRWKHGDNPFGPSAVLVAEAEGRLVGLRAFMRWRFLDGGRPVRAVRAVDTVTHPEWQGQGLFTRLTKQLCNDLAAEGVDLVFNTPNDKSRPGYLKMGWQDLGRVLVWGRPLPPRLRRTPPVPTARTALADVEGTVVPAAGLHTPVDGPYLRWRYGAVPGLDYRAVVDDDVVVVGRGRRRTVRGVSLREAMICEIVVGRGLGGVVRASRAVRRLASALDARYAIAVAPLRSRQAAALVAAGFVPVPRAGPHFTVCALQSEGAGPRALSPSAWALGLGDLELF